MAIERKVTGNDMLLFIDPAGGTSYSLVVCLTSNSFNIANAVIDAKSKCGPDNLPGVQSFEVSFEGQIIWSPDSGRVGHYSLLTLASNKTTIGWKMAKATNTVDGNVSITGTAFIANVDSTFADEAPGTFACTLGIYGTPTIAEVNS